MTWNEIILLGQAQREYRQAEIYYCVLIGFGPGKINVAICNLQFAILQSVSPTTPYKAGHVVKFICQYDPDFQRVRISHAILESIHLNKSINCKERIKIFTIGVFCFNMWYYVMLKIWFSTLEILSLHYILHASCPVLIYESYYKSQQRKPFQGPFTPGLYPWYQSPDILPIFAWGNWFWWSTVAWSQVRM